MLRTGSRQSGVIRSVSARNFPATSSPARTGAAATSSKLPSRNSPLNIRMAIKGTASMRITAPNPNRFSASSTVRLATRSSAPRPVKSSTTFRKIQASTS